MQYLGVLRNILADNIDGIFRREEELNSDGRVDEGKFFFSVNVVGKFSIAVDDIFSFGLYFQFDFVNV